MWMSLWLELCTISIRLGFCIHGGERREAPFPSYSGVRKLLGAMAGVDGKHFFLWQFTSLEKLRKLWHEGRQWCKVSFVRHLNRSIGWVQLVFPCHSKRNPIHSFIWTGNKLLALLLHAESACLSTRGNQSGLLVHTIFQERVRSRVVASLV